MQQLSFFILLKFFYINYFVDRLHIFLLPSSLWRYYCYHGLLAKSCKRNNSAPARERSRQGQNFPIYRFENELEYWEKLHFQNDKLENFALCV